MEVWTAISAHYLNSTVLQVLSAIERLHEIALHKFIIDIDIDVLDLRYFW